MRKFSLKRCTENKINFRGEKRNKHFSYKTNLLKSQTNIKQSLGGGGNPSWCLYEKQDKINLRFYRQT